MQRVAVVGTSCSGKTTLAAAIARAQGSPHVELDALHWLPDWKERPTEEFREKTREAIRGDAWVTDGNYSRVRDMVWGRATHVIWLNYSFPLVLWRAIRRSLTRLVTREELYSGNMSVGIDRAVRIDVGCYCELAWGGHFVYLPRWKSSGAAAAVHARFFKF